MIVSFLRVLVKKITLHLPGKGLPFGNLTSQFFANIYFHEFDFFVKQKLQEQIRLGNGFCGQAY
ncbi:MAG: Reverse transcriptase protein [Candidatus Magasanikbacteria bacterium]|nr:Reverse transcriptase protein [Candidatus Magasanikbacteria bacterium]